jgi:hypothetical protein
MRGYACRKGSEMTDVKQEPAPEMPTAFMDDAMVAAVETYLLDAEVYLFEVPDSELPVTADREED